MPFRQRACGEHLVQAIGDHLGRIKMAVAQVEPLAVSHSPDQIGRIAGTRIRRGRIGRVGEGLQKTLQIVSAAAGMNRTNAPALATGLQLQ